MKLIHQYLISFHMKSVLNKVLHYDKYILLIDWDIVAIRRYKVFM